MTKDVVVLSAVRSAVSTFNGSLAGLEPSDLAGRVMKKPSPVLAWTPSRSTT